MTTNTEHEMNEAICPANGKNVIAVDIAHERGRRSSVGKKLTQPNFTNVDGPLAQDPYGLPMGEASLKIWQGLLTYVDEKLEQKGWDQPATLYALYFPEDQNWRLEAERMGALEKGNRRDSQKGVSGIAISDPLEITGKIVEELWGFNAPEWASGLILAYEAWTVEPMAEGAGEDQHKNLRPSEHPRRKEVRLLTLFTRGGERHSLIHPRGEAVRLSGKGEEGQMGGLIPEVLARSLGLPALGATRSVAEYLGCITLNTSLKMARQFNEIPTGIDFDKAERKLLSRMSAKERRSTGSDLAVEVALERTKQICQRVLKADVTFIKMESSGEPAKFEKLLELAIEAGEVSWSHFVKVAGNYLPADAPDQSWAGEALFSQYVLDRYCPDQKTLIAELKELMRPSAFGAVLDLCESAGWLS
jgi:hypothetical protein